MAGQVARLAKRRDDTLPEGLRATPNAAAFFS